MENTLMQAHQQWASRPEDERFISLPEMAAFKNTQRANSRASVVSSRQIEAAPFGDDHKGLLINSPAGQDIAPTNYSFGQVATLAGAPAGYLRKLPSELAADCINFGLHVTRDIEDVGLLSYQNGGGPELRAATGPKYGRIWDADILARLIEYVGDGVTGQWKVPGEFGKPVVVDRGNTTLYASDRDMWLFLADEENLIELPGAGRDGGPDLLARGFFLWNSEVGAKTFGISTFLFRYVCCNRMIWGARDQHTVKIRHSAGAPDKFLEEAVPALEDYSQSSQVNILDSLQKARETVLADNMEDWLATRFTSRLAKKAMDLHEVEEGRPVVTAWDTIQAITSVARDLPHQDDRVALERRAGDIIDLVAA